MKRMIFSIMLLFCFSQLNQVSGQTNTDGTVSFSVSTTSIGGNYSPRHVLAIWIKDSEGNFVISRKVLAASRKQHLVKWMGSSGNNSVNAVTGPTINNHTTHTISWDCRDLSGNLVPDGTYEIWMEYSSRNSANDGVPGPSAHISFEKGTDQLNLTFQDAAYFKQMSLTYEPLGVSITESEPDTHTILISPNPTREMINLKFELAKDSYVNINLYDTQGRRIRELVDDNIISGPHHYSFNLDEECTNQTLFLRLIINKELIIRKINCLKL